MQQQSFRRAATLVALIALAWSTLVPLPVSAQGKYVVKPVAELRIKQLPKGPLYWRWNYQY